MCDALSGWLYGGMPALLGRTGGERSLPIEDQEASGPAAPAIPGDPLMASGTGGSPAVPGLRASPTVERGEQ
jgi:hypothetical protein